MNKATLPGRSSHFHEAVRMSRPPPPSAESFSFLIELFGLLKEAGFSAANLNRLFPDTTLTGRDTSRTAAYRMRIHQSDLPAFQMARFWLLRELLPKEEWWGAFDRNLVDKGLACGVIAEREGQFESNFDFQPGLERVVLTDPKFRHPWETGRTGVYYLGSDSYGLVNTVPRKPFQRGLDLFTGSGVHAILAADHCQNVVGVDINPRAVQIARANAGLNALDGRCTFLQSDLFQAVEGKTFDLITANPPFVPTPNQDLALYRSGGEGGELFTAAVLGRLHEFLEPGGLMAMVTNYPVFKGIEVLSHHRDMLGKPNEFGLALLHSYLFPPETYIQMHIAHTGNPQKDADEFNRWLESYARQDISGIGFGVLFFQRLVKGEPWQAVKEVPNIVTAPLSHEVEFWLDGLRRCGEGAGECELTLHPRAQLLVNPNSGEGVLRWKESDWPETSLEPHEATIIAQSLKGRGSITGADTVAVERVQREGYLVPAL